jgi:hypothetical protein
LQQMAATNPRKKSRSSIQMDITCRHCGEKGHSTTRSKQCLHYKQPMVTQEEQQPLVLPGEDAELIRIDAAGDVLTMDMLGLQGTDIQVPENNII